MVQWIEIRFMCMVYIVQLCYSSDLHIGGLFDTFNYPTASLARQQSENLAAFVMAIREINNKSDGIYDNILPHHQLKFALGNPGGYARTVQSVFAIENAFSDGILGVVGSLTNADTLASDLLMADLKTVQVHSMAMNSEFGAGVTYPYKSQTCPLDSYQGIVIQSIICSRVYNWTRATIFATSDTFGNNAAMEVSDGTYCQTTILSTHFFRAETTDFTAMIQSAQTEGAQVFIFFMGAANAAAVLEQGFSLGLFHEGTQVIGSVSAISDDTIRHLSPGSNTVGIMKGCIGVEYWPNYSLTHSSTGLAFLKRWLVQPPTVSYNSSGNMVCDKSMDDTGVNYIYQDPSPPSNSTWPGCAGLNFSSYLPDGSDLTAYVGLTYDATVVLAMGLHYLVESGAQMTADTLKQALYDNVRFDGVSGLVTVFAGDHGTLDLYGAGSRESGHHYRVTNFNAAMYDITANESFVQIALWSPEAGIQSCDDCQAPIYNTADNKPTSAFPPFAFATSPEVIKIGALFGLFDSGGHVNKEQAENFAAFVLAVHQINNKTDGIYDDILPNSQLKFALAKASGYSGTIKATEQLLSSFYNSGVVGVIGALPDSDTMASYELLTGAKIVQVQSKAMSSAFGSGSTYPYKIQTVPLDSYQGMVTQSLLCSRFQWSKVSIFATTDVFGNYAAMEVSDNSFCPTTILSAHYFPPETADFTSIIQAAKLVGSRIFIIFTTEAATAARLLEQGHAMDLFILGTQILGSLSVMSPEIFPHFSPSADIPSIMKGCIGMQYWPEYSRTRTAAGKRFLSTWIQQASTNQGDVESNTKNCSDKFDDSGFDWLYKFSPHMPACAGLNFSSYAGHEASLSPFVGATYDATIVLAMALHYVAESGQDITGDNLKKAMFSNISFEGVTGKVSVFKGDHTIVTYGEGSRETGHHYKVINFNSDLFRMNPNNSFVQIAAWSPESGMMPCDSETICEIPVFNTLDNKPPSDSHPDILVVMSRGEIIVLQVIGAFVIATALIFGIFLVVYRNSNLIKASQPVMLYFILLGEILGGGRVLIASVQMTDATCTGGLWLAHLAFAFVFGALFIKTYRIHRLLNNVSLKRVKFTTADVVVYMGVAILCVCLMLIVLTFVGKPRQSSINSTASNQVSKIMRCSFRYTQIHTAIFVLEAMVMIVGARLCWAVKNVPDAVNEAKFIAFAMIIIVMMAALVFPIVFLINMPPPTQQLVASASFGIAALSSMIITLAPKLLVLVSGHDIDKNLGMSGAAPAPAPPGTGARSSSTSNKVHPTNTDFPALAVSDGEPESLKNKSVEQKELICTAQLAKWNELLAQIRSSKVVNPNTDDKHAIAIPFINIHQQPEKSAEVHLSNFVSTSECAT